MTARLWADGPFLLIETPSKSKDVNTHSAIYCASEMAHAHNVLIRGLNSLYRQAAHVRSPEDIRDFLFFCVAWVKTVEHHHHTEEHTLFPALEKFTKQPGIMEGNMQQHQAFLPGLHSFRDYVQNTTAENYSSETVMALADGFAPTLMGHLREEIDTLLGLNGYDSLELMKVWTVTENVAKGAAHPNRFDTIIPCVLGCADRSYEGGIHNFPPLPFFIPYIVHYWFAGKHRGAWRFCPCDMWGKPRPLLFLP